MNSPKHLSKLFAATSLHGMKGTNSLSISESSNLFPGDVTFTTLDGLPNSTITAISSELKKTLERIGQILAGNQNHV